MSAPTFVGKYDTAFTGTGVASRTSSSFDAQDGDRLVVIGITSDNSATLNTPTNNGAALVWTLKASIATGTDLGAAYVWTATVSGARTGMTVSVTRAGQSFNQWGFEIQHWRDSDGFGLGACTGASDFGRRDERRRSG